MQGLHHVVLCLDRRIRTSTCDRSWICLSMHGFGRLDEFWALNIHSLWIEYSWKNRDPIWTNTHKPEGWLVNSLNCFQCGGLELAQIFGWSLTHHKFFWSFIIFFRKTASSKTILFLLGDEFEGNSSQVTWHIGRWHTLKRVPSWELTYPIQRQLRR